MAYFFNEAGAINTVGTSYSVSKKISFTLSHSSSKYFLSKLHCVQIFLSDISSATVVNIKITNDSNGDSIILPDTPISIDNGLTTNTDGIAVLDVDSLLYSPVEDFFLFAKVDAGSCDIDKIYVTFEST